MFVSLPIITTALVTLSTLASTVSASCCAKPTYKHQKKILDNYIASWNGDTSRGNATFDSDAKLFADRILNGTGSIDIYPIQTSVGIMDFIQKGRFGWEKYQFELVNWAGGEGYNIALRWTLHGVVGADFPKRANITAKPGSTVEYHGTDFLQLDHCSGLIKQADIAQDYITYYHQLGATELNI